MEAESTASSAPVEASPSTSPAIPDGAHLTTPPVRDGNLAAHGEGEHDAGGHTDPITPVLAAIIIVLFLAKVGGDVFERMNLPPVLGELTVGIILGNMGLVGVHFFEQMFVLPENGASTELYNTAAIMKILAGIGVILLLFEVGLESTVSDMMSVGVSSFIVAVVGVIVPIILGWGVAWAMIPAEDPKTDWQVHAFIGATLCATSVGITARVLKDLGKSQLKESRIILGAAVIDDVLGLIVLAIVAGVIAQGTVSASSLMLIVGKAVGFLAGAVLLGALIFTRPLFKAASFLHGHGLMIATALVICLGFSWLASMVGLAPIVGAFAAGLILEGAQYRELGARENRTLTQALEPLAATFVPIFFVQMGTQVDLRSFSDPSVWGLAAGITIAAIIGKQVCAFGAVEKGLNRLSIGLGMIPRGEVGLIFAQVGRDLRVHGEPVISTQAFSAVVVMVIITTMVTPPLLKWAMNRSPSTSGEVSA